MRPCADCLCRQALGKIPSTWRFEIITGGLSLLARDGTGSFSRRWQQILCFVQQVFVASLGRTDNALAHEGTNLEV